MTQQPSSATAPVAATTNLALVASFAALVAVCSVVAVPLPGLSTPLTLQTFAVLLAGMVLGARRGALAVLLYLAVGLAGLPVFAQGFGGLAVLGRASAGFLAAFPFAAFLVGLLVERLRARGRAAALGALALAGLAGSLLVYALGVPVMALRTGLSLGQAAVASLAFVPLDLVKLALAVVVAAAVHRAFPDLLPRR